MAPFLPEAIAHEGLGVPLPPNGHAGVFRDELNRRGPSATEGAVALGNIGYLPAKASVRA